MTNTTTLKLRNNFEWGHDNNIFERFFKREDVQEARKAGIDEWVEEITDSVAALERELAISKRALVILSKDTQAFRQDDKLCQACSIYQDYDLNGTGYDPKICYECNIREAIKQATAEIDSFKEESERHSRAHHALTGEHDKIDKEATDADNQ